MAGPWEKFQGQPQASNDSSGPWAKFGASVPEKTGAGESFARGAAQGATLGFQDELSPYVERLIANVVGNKDVRDLYASKTNEDLRSTYRAQNKLAEKSHPGAYLGGELAGGIGATAPLLPAAPTAGGLTLGALATKEGLKQASKLALRGAIENAALGGISAAGAAEQDKGKAALGALGPSALLGGIASGAGQPAIGSASALLKKTIQSSHGIPNKILGYIEKNPQKLDAIKAAAVDKNQAIADLSEDIAAKMSSRFDDIIRSRLEIIDDAVAQSGDHRINGSKVLAAIDDRIKSLDRGGITEPVEGAIGFLKSIKNKFNEKFGLKVKKQVSDEALRYVGDSPFGRVGATEPISGDVLLSRKNVPGAGVTVEKINTIIENLGPYPTADQLNVLRKEFNDLARSSYNRKLNTGNPVLAQSADDIADALRSVLDEVSPDIRTANKELSEVIKRRELVAKKFSVPSLLSRDNQIDPSDVQKLLTRAGSEAHASNQHILKSLKEITNIDIPEASKFVGAVKAMDTEGANFLSKFPTGRAVLTPLIGGALGAGGGYLSGEDVATMGLLGALGLAGGTAAQSKAGLNVLLNEPKIRGAAQTILENLRRGTAVQKGMDNTMEFEPIKVTPGRK